MITPDNTTQTIKLDCIKGFLEKSGDEIWVESIEGDGSSFYFTLPNKKPLNKTDSSDEIIFESV